MAPAMQERIARGRKESADRPGIGTLPRGRRAATPFAPPPRGPSPAASQEDQFGKGMSRSPSPAKPAKSDSPVPGSSPKTRMARAPGSHVFPSTEEREQWYASEYAARRACVRSDVLPGEESESSLSHRSLTPFWRPAFPVPGNRRELFPQSSTHRMNAPDPVQWHLSWTDAEVSALEYFLRVVHGYRWVSALECIEFFEPSGVTRYESGHPHAADRRGGTRDKTARQHATLSMERIATLMCYDVPMPRTPKPGEKHPFAGKRFGFHMEGSEPACVYLRALGDHEGRSRGRTVARTKLLSNDSPNTLVGAETQMLRDHKRQWSASHPLPYASWLRQHAALRPVLLGGTPQDVPYVVRSRTAKGSPLRSDGSRAQKADCGGGEW